MGHLILRRKRVHPGDMPFKLWWASVEVPDAMWEEIGGHPQLSPYVQQCSHIHYVELCANAIARLMPKHVRDQVNGGQGVMKMTWGLKYFNGAKRMTIRTTADKTYLPNWSARAEIDKPQGQFMYEAGHLTRLVLHYSGVKLGDKVNVWVKFTPLDLHTEEKHDLGIPLPRKEGAGMNA